MQIFIKSLLIFLLLASCTIRTADFDREKVIIEVEQTLNNYCADIKRSGLLAEIEYLDNSTEFFWVPPGYASSLTYDSVVSILKQYAPKYVSVDNSFDTSTVIALSNNHAIYTGKMTSEITDQLGNIFKYKLMETGVMVKRNAGWKLLSGQTTVVKNLSENNMNANK